MSSEKAVNTEYRQAGSEECDKKVRSEQRGVYSELQGNCSEVVRYEK